MYKIVMTEKVVQDSMDELWAEKAVAEFSRKKTKKLYSLTEVKQKLGCEKE